MQVQVQDRHLRHSLSLCVYSWIVRGKAGVVVLTLLVLIESESDAGVCFCGVDPTRCLLREKKNETRKNARKKKRMPPRL